MYETRVVIAFVEVFEDGREDFRFFIGKGDSFGRSFEELSTAGGREEGGDAEDVFVGCEESLLAADDESYYGGC